VISGKKRIMIADDEEFIRSLVAATLGGDERFEVILARDGEETMELAQRERPDLILLDILMPKLNGLEVCRQLKGNSETSHIKVIMLTALGDAAHEMRAREAGADGYFSKPFSPTALLRCIEEVLNL